MSLHSSSIEPLEPRIAPATVAFVNPTTATYTDVDGDLVTIKFTKAILNAGNVGDVLKTTPIDATHDQLQRIDLTVMNLAKPAAGTNITMTVVPKLPGDGFANVGYVNATGIDIGAVTIRGDLDAIDAGDAITKTAGLKSLTVQSFGGLGTTTGAPDVKSDILGGLGSLVVKQDMTGNTLEVTGGTPAAAKDGKIGSITINGSLAGGSGMRLGTIHTTGDMGKVKIGIDLGGGFGTEAGGLLSDGKIASVTIGGDLLGGGAISGLGAGFIRSGGDIGAVSIGGDILGGIGDSSGSIISGGKLASVKLGGSLQGGIAKIGANGTPRNGYISSVGDMGKITIAGDILGTFLPFAGSIVSGGKIASVSVGGDLLGSEEHSGFISSAGAIGMVKIGGDVSGGFGASSGAIVSAGDIARVSIGGDLGGGTATGTGFISGVTLGAITINGGVFGGNSLGAFSFTDSGAIVGATIKSITIGTLQGGSAGNNTLARTGYVFGNTITKLTINGDLIGGSISGTGSIIDSGAISGDHLGQIVINGRILGGTIGASGAVNSVIRAGAIVSTHDIASVTVKGSVLGGADAGKGAVPVLISAVGQLKPTAKTDLAIGSISIGGKAFLTNILAGYNPAGSAVNGGAQIGAVSVGMDWDASNLVAGAMNAAAMNKSFGNSDDAAIPTGSAAAIAKIASIKIGGPINGTAAATSATDHFGFVAHKIGSFTIGGIKIPLPTTPTFLLDIGSTADTSLHQI